MFYVGQKVVFVDDRPDLFRRDLQLTKGEIYTVASIHHRFGGFGITVCEVDCIGAPGWRASRFRPLTDQKKSVSFTQGAPRDSERWDNRRKVVEPAKVGGV